MNNVFSKPVFRSGNVLLWIIAAIVFRVIILSFFISSAKQLSPERIISGFAIQQNDYEYFLGPVDQYFQTGIFQYENSPGKSFAGRMPGYSSVYFLIRLLLDKHAALTVLFILQILLSSICVYVLALLAEKITSSRNVFLVTFLLFSISIHTALFDIFSLAESFSVSALILFFYFAWKYFENNKISTLLLVGFFAAWSIFLRPFLGLIILLFPVIILIYQYKKIAFKTIIIRCFLFALPFIIFESLWIYRNYKELGRFIPLETSLSESYGERGAYRTSAISIRSLIFAWGGETGEFYEGSEAAWFHFGDANNYTFHPYVFNSSFNRDSLVALKKIFNSSIDSSLSNTQLDSLNMLASTTALRYAATYKNDNKFRYYFINPLVRAGKIIFTNGTRLLPLPRFDQMSIMQKAIKLFYFFFFFFITIIGIVGMIVFYIRRKPLQPGAALILLFPLLLAFTLIFFSDILEFRYFIGAYPIFLIFTSWFIVDIVEKLDRKYSLKRNRVVS